MFYLINRSFGDIKKNRSRTRVRCTPASIFYYVLICCYSIVEYILCREILARSVWSAMICPIGWDTMGWEGWKKCPLRRCLRAKKTYENIWKHARSEELLPLSSILTAISLTAEQPILFSSDTAAGKRPMRSLKRRFVSLICLLQLGEPEWCVSAWVLSSRPAIQVSIIYIYNHTYI